MRNPERISPLWDKLFEAFKKAHSIYPDWRFGQFCSNFFGWLMDRKKVDLFFPEENSMMKYIKEYLGAE